MDNCLNSVEKGSFGVNNQTTSPYRVRFSTETGHVIHALFTTYTDVVQDTFCENRVIIRTFHSR